MKPPKFDYFAPDSIESALTLIAEHGDDARYLAGGQSLVPMMNFRVAAPSVWACGVPDPVQNRFADCHMLRQASEVL